MDALVAFGRTEMPCLLLITSSFLSPPSRETETVVEAGALVWACSNASGLTTTAAVFLDGVKESGGHEQGGKKFLSASESQPCRRSNGGPLARL